MIINFIAFNVLITLALLVTCVSPLLLLGFLVKDWVREELW